MEPLKLKPDIYPFLYRVLWLLWPPSLFIVLYFCDFFSEDITLLAFVIVVLFFVHFIQALNWHWSDLGISDDTITETFRGHIIFFLRWSEINSVTIFSTNRYWLPNRHTLAIYYGDPDNPRIYYYRLSELSDVDQKKVREIIGTRVKDFEE